MELRQPRNFLAAGRGVSLMPRMSEASVELTPPRPSCPLSFTWRRGAVLSPAARALETFGIQRLQGRTR